MLDSRVFFGQPSFEFLQCLAYVPSATAALQIEVRIPLLDGGMALVVFFSPIALVSA